MRVAFHTLSGLLILFASVSCGGTTPAPSPGNDTGISKPDVHTSWRVTDYQSASRQAAQANSRKAIPSLSTRTLACEGDNIGHIDMKKRIRKRYDDACCWTPTRLTPDGQPGGSTRWAVNLCSCAVDANCPYP